MYNDYIYTGCGLLIEFQYFLFKKLKKCNNLVFLSIHYFFIKMEKSLFSLLNNDILILFIKKYILVHFRKLPYSKILISLDHRFSKIIQKKSWAIKKNYTFREIKLFFEKRDMQMIDYIIRSGLIYDKETRLRGIPKFFDSYKASLESALKGATKGMQKTI